jgi:hypothetical protein
LKVVYIFRLGNMFVWSIHGSKTVNELTQ